MEKSGTDVWLHLFYVPLKNIHVLNDTWVNDDNVYFCLIYPIKKVDQNSV